MLAAGIHLHLTLARNLRRTAHIARCPDKKHNGGKEPGHEPTDTFTMKLGNFKYRHHSFSDEVQKRIRSISSSAILSFVRS